MRKTFCKIEIIFDVMDVFSSGSLDVVCIIPLVRLYYTYPVVGLVIANGAFLPSIMVDVVVAILGGGTVASLVKCTVNAYCDYKDIKDIYIDARACGSKI